MKYKYIVKYRDDDKIAQIARYKKLSDLVEWYSSHNKWTKSNAWTAKSLLVRNYRKMTEAELFEEFL